MPIASDSLATPIPREVDLGSTMPGIWDMEWGSIKQVCTYSKDGSYDGGPIYGKGDWTRQYNDDGSYTVWFSEDGRRYSMTIDPKGDGTGWAYNSEDGSVSYGVVVKFTKRKATKVKK